jgi:hypothetical protein
VTVLPAAAILPDDIGFYLSMMVVGFVIGVIGHVWKIRRLVALGIGLIFLATFLLPVAIIATNDKPETQSVNPY